MSAAAVIDLARLTPRPCVYFVQDDEDGLVKIGRSIDLRHRLGSLQSSSARPLRLLGHIGLRTERHMIDLERQLHRRFAADREHGEWFRPTSEVRSWATLAKVIDGRTRFELPPAQLVEELREAVREGAFL